MSIYCNTDDSPRASIDVISHNRTQFLHNEKFTVSCQLPDDNTQWKMMRLGFYLYQNMKIQTLITAAEKLQ